MAIRSSVADDPRHYESSDGRILPVSGTHGSPRADCDTCSFTPTRPTNFVIGQKVLFSHGQRRGIEGLICKVGRRFVTIVWTTKAGRRRESHRLANEISPVAHVRDARLSRVS